MALPKDLPTLQAHNTGNYTRPDNVFINSEFLDAVVSCNTCPSLRPIHTDHFPILTVLDISPPVNADAPRRNYREVDWPEFTKALGNRVKALPEPREYVTVAELQAALTDFNAAITATIHEHVPISRPCPWTKRWWSKELAQAKTRVSTLSNKSYRHRYELHHPCHEEFRRQRNDY
ncbi:hypothetical protein PLICRDRAFT_109303, partial [Plicaturopsis crispa FD-325 SS-3]